MGLSGCKSGIRRGGIGEQFQQKLVGVVLGVKV